ncbi:MAG TPA: hypothetical protein PLC42_00805 [Parachlamydiaceae bacterium]|nr:hypothetical protein [Parachlamydiaceae bacterium]
MKRAILLILLFFAACSSKDSDENSSQITQKAEFIYRTHQERYFTKSPLKKQKPKPYPWEIGMNGKYPPITKEYFRCKGSSLNPPRSPSQNELDKSTQFYDCGGSERHSLPLKDGKEFVYPILMDLLNYLQLKTEKRVVITCGHRCPDHNNYSDPAKENQYSKHMLGAEVSFYIQGMEEDPEAVLELLQEYYNLKKEYAKNPDFIEFKTYEKNDTNVSTPPIYNKEIFIKLFKKTEGRNFDNRHPYPYISIQVRYDKEKNERVTYSWKEAHQNFLRK